MYATLVCFRVPTICASPHLILMILCSSVVISKALLSSFVSMSGWRHSMVLQYIPGSPSQQCPILNHYIPVDFGFLVGDFFNSF